MRKEEFARLKEEFVENRIGYEEKLANLISKFYLATIYYGGVDYENKALPEHILHMGDDYKNYGGSQGKYLCYDLDALIKFCCTTFRKCNWNIRFDKCWVYGENGAVIVDSRKSYY